LILLVLACGCASKPAIKDYAAADADVIKARKAAIARVDEMAPSYVKGSETAEAIGYAILSDCGNERVTLVSAMQRRARLDLASARKADISERFAKIETEVSDMVYREGVAAIIRLRRSVGLTTRE